MRKVLLAVALALAALLIGRPASAQRFEHIRDFRAEIVVLADGSVEVTEEIEVLALGHTIKRGIYRDLKLASYDPLGLFSPDFAVLEATRDGAEETHRVSGTGAGVRVWLGHPDRFLEPGVYRYRLRYRMADQVDRFEDFDEIYWDVNGTGWSFVTMRVAAAVVLPAGGSVLQHAAYTGHAGERGGDVTATRRADGAMVFTTTRPLAAGENLTVAVGFPKGVVTGERGGAWLRWMFERDPMEVAAVLLAVLVGYYGIVWLFVGRDPRAGTIVPVYSPTIPPAAMRFIRRMGFDADCVAAALLSMAVKGHVTLEEDAKNRLTLRRAVPPEGAPELSPGEAALYSALLGARGSVLLDQSNQATLASAREALKRHFERTFNRHFFRRNRVWFVLGAVLTVLGWLVVSMTQPMLLLAFVQAIWLGVLGFIVVALGRQGMRMWRSLRAGGLQVERFGFGVLIVVGGFFVWGFSASFVQIAIEMGWETTAAVVVLGGINLVFLHLLKAPTALGRGALDEIEGTRRYLTVAEADRLRFHNPPERTPEHFEAMLPYAVALGVETDWTRQFADVLERAAAARDEGYRPRWYHGSRFSGARLSDLGQVLGASYATAATPKSSSSGGGSRGGGSSGGGRGGGGGGGW
jgi:uncharacterized membrane protein YgcG